MATTSVVILALLVCSSLAQDFPDADHSLTLTGPDEENMLVCSPQIALPLDTTVTWYVNGKALKTEFYPRDLRHLYESLQDLTDLLGDVPKTVQCVIKDGHINWVPVVSNKITLNV